MKNFARYVLGICAAGYNAEQTPKHASACQKGLRHLRLRHRAAQTDVTKGSPADAGLPFFDVGCFGPANAITRERSRGVGCCRCR